ncbi:NADPH-dependent FMN reductase-like protein, partial [Mycena capillaripes]
FIFLTPQYNWGYPAALKLALDALYFEWTNKPVLVLSYGNRGGGKSAAQLRQVLDGLHM